MNKKKRVKLERALSTYFREIHKIYVSGDFREESFYSSFKRLVEECCELFQMHKNRDSDHYYSRIELLHVNS